MTPTSPSSSGHSPQDFHSSSGNAFRVVRKRNRVPLSCGPCRNRKLKCNRQTPCENCVRRNDASSCTYATNTHSHRYRKVGSSGSTGSDEMQSRIDRLEGLVLSLMSGNTNHQSPPRQRDGQSSSSVYPDSHDGDEEEDDNTMGHDGRETPSDHQGGQTVHVEDEVEEVRNALGLMKVHGGRTFYRGGEYWAAILLEISEVKKYFEETKQKYEDELAAMRCGTTLSKLQATGFPFSATPPPTKRVLLSLVPKKPVVDRLVDCFFTHHARLYCVLHRVSFYKQYEDFWRDTSEVDVLWLGLLMIVMSIAIKIYDLSGESLSELPAGSMEMWLAFRNASEQCLVVGDYTKKLYIHTVQTLILLSVSSTQEDSWFQLGSVIRIAMSIGLHRDSGQFSDISLGEGEIRRRLWTLITCLDLLTSIRIGMPCMVGPDSYDTRLPKNLHDNEIGEGITELPPERGKEESTSISYLVHLASMSHTLWEVNRLANSVKARPPFEQVLKLEAEIDCRYEAIPSFLKYKSMEDSINDPAWLVVQRQNLYLLRQMVFLAIHRPYAARASQNPKYLHSYQKCIDSAMQVLKCQNDLFSRSPEALRYVRWYINTHTTHEYLQAAAVIFLDLSYPHKSTLEERKLKYAALCRSRDHHSRLRENIDASRAHGVLSFMLDKLARNESAYQEAIRKHNEQQQQQQRQQQYHSPSSFDQRYANLSATVTIQPPEFPSVPSNNVLSDPPMSLGSEQAAAITLGMMSGGNLSLNSTYAAIFDRSIIPTPSETINPGIVSTPDNPQLPQLTAALPGWTSLWNGAAAFDTMPGGHEWDEWDEFMKGIDMDPGQLNGYPVIPGIPAYPPPTPIKLHTSHMVLHDRRGGGGASGEEGGGGGGIGGS
ncbi:hypothetical protein BDD12DRAFT_774351 [Trichophaea hybrida]|nr:hypothetical protein BDD12DRAFT_774351 [Trichophaea hybrida]